MVVITGTDDIKQGTDNSTVFQKLTRCLNRMKAFVHVAVMQIPPAKQSGIVSEIDTYNYNLSKVSDEEISVITTEPFTKMPKSKVIDVNGLKPS